MTAALFGYKYLLCSVCFVVYVVRAIDAAMGVTTAYPDGSHCIDPWKRHDQSCYLFMAGKYDFTEAKKRCSDQEAHLVSINDDAENEFIKTERIRSSADPAWVGLYRQTPICNHLTSCDWMWLDGNQLGYYNWPPGALPTISQCALIEPNGFWSNGRDCDAELDAICKRDVWYPTPTSDNSGITIGCVVGVLCLIAIIVAVSILIKRRRASSQTDRPVEEKDEETSMVEKHARRMKNKNETEAEGKVSTGVTDYDDIAMPSSSYNHDLGPPSISVGGVYENTPTTDAPVRPSNHVDDTGNHPVYEMVTRDTDVSPEYTRLQFTDQFHTNDNN